MKTQVFSIYDIKTMIYHQPMFAINEHHAIRVIKLEFNKQGSMLNEYPEDFDIYLIGEFDDRKGTLEKNVPPLLVCKGSVLVDKKKTEAKTNGQ